jgi:hypothetical protein
VRAPAKLVQLLEGVRGVPDEQAPLDHVELGQDIILIAERPDTSKPPKSLSAPSR